MPGPGVEPGKPEDDPEVRAVWLAGTSDRAMGNAGQTSTCLEQPARGELPARYCAAQAVNRSIRGSTFSTQNSVSSSIAPSRFSGAVGRF
jgi:hypothetical protein